MSDVVVRLEGRELTLQQVVDIVSAARALLMRSDPAWVESRYMRAALEGSVAGDDRKVTVLKAGAPAQTIGRTGGRARA